MDAFLMSVSLPPDKLDDIVQLAFLVDSICYSLSGHVLFRQGQFFLPVATCSGSDYVMSFRNTSWLFITLQPNYFLLYTFPFQLFINYSCYLICNRSQFLCNFHFLMCLLLQMPHPVIGPFISRAMDCHYHLVDPGQVLCVGFILPCRNLNSWHDAT